MLDEAHTILYVTDVNRCAAFYRDLLGMPVQLYQGRALVKIKGVSLLLLPRDNERSRGTGPIHLAFDVANLDQIYRDFSAKSIVFSAPPEETAIGKQATMCDPDGTPIDLIEWAEPGAHAVSDRTVVNDVLQRSPEAMEVLEEHGIRICGGCIVLLNGTVRETAEYSGLSAAESDKMVHELNDKLNQLH